MDLSTFVGESLRQIAAGVKAVQSDVERLGGVVNPQGFAPAIASAGPLYDFRTNSVLTMVEMEVSVVASEKSDGKGGLSVAIGVVTAGKGKGTSEGRETTSRLRFSVPMQLPLGGTPLPPPPPEPQDDRPRKSWATKYTG